MRLSSLERRRHLKIRDESLLEPMTVRTLRKMGGKAGKQPHMIPMLTSTTEVMYTGGIAHVKSIVPPFKTR